jgi:hypothetical protein
MNSELQTPTDVVKPEETAKDEKNGKKQKEVNTMPDSSESTGSFRYQVCSLIINRLQPNI